MALPLVRQRSNGTRVISSAWFRALTVFYLGTAALAIMWLSSTRSDEPSPHSTGGLGNMHDRGPAQTSIDSIRSSSKDPVSTARILRGSELNAGPIGEVEILSSDEQGELSLGHREQSLKKSIEVKKAAHPTTKSVPSRRPVLVPGRWSPGNETQMRVELQTLGVAAMDEDVLRDRAEFGALNLCSPFHVWYSCNNNPSCVMNTTCVHRPEFDPVVFRKDIFLMAQRYHDDAPQRRAVLREILHRMDQTVGRGMLWREQKILIMTLNSGFSFLFGNWLCSLAANGVDVEYVKSKTMVLARDHDARRYVESLGFFVPTAKEMTALTKWTAKSVISQKPAMLFGQGDHKDLNLFFKFGMPLDLFELNMTIYLQDVDFVWLHSPLDRMAQQCRAENCHAIFIDEGRLFVRDPPSPKSPYREGRRPLKEFNTGLYMLTPQPEVKRFLRVLMHGLHLQQWRRRDQLYYNSVAWHRHFSHMRWSILPADLFVPGQRLHENELEVRPLRPASELVVLHVSDTQNYERKIIRLKDLNHWYFTSDKCPLAVNGCRNITSCWSSLDSCPDCQA